METNLSSNELIISSIQNQIYIVRGKKVILDRDLAKLYQVETRVLNQAVKRNLTRFPNDFMFQLTHEELMDIMQQFSSSQNVILNISRGHNIKYLPYVFTEHGVVMMASMLKSQIAITTSVLITRAFIAMRQAIQNMANTEIRLEQLSAKVDQLQIYIEDILHDQNEINEDISIQLELINQSLAELQTMPKPIPRKPIGFES